MRTRVRLVVGAVLVTAVLFGAAPVEAVGFEEAPLFTDSWGTVGSGPGQLSNPRGVDTDSAGNVYVADTGNHRIVKFDAEGRFLQTWGSFGSANGQFRSPWDVTVDNNDLVIVADTGNHRIQAFDDQGVFQRKWGSLGGGNLRFRGPKGVGHDSLNNVYVADTGNDRIVKYTGLGVFTTRWGSAGAAAGQFESPRDVTASINNRVFVADTNNDRVQMFDLVGTYVDEWGGNGTGDGQFDSPQGVFIQNQGSVTTTLFVTDTNNDRVQQFTNTGTYLDQWGGTGNGNGELDGPRGIVVDEALRAYTTEVGNDRVASFDSLVAEGMRGQVTSTDGLTDNGPIANAFVTISDSATFDLLATARTDVAGNYQAGLPPGSYVLAFLDPTGNHDYEYFDDQPDFTTTTPVTVVTDTVTTVDAALTETPVVPPPTTGTIAGDLTDPGGAAAGTWVMAIDSTGTPVLTTIADPLGHYAIEGLAPGGYLVLFLDPQGTNIAEFFDDTPDPTFADQVVVTAAVTTEVDAALTP